jgi:hypothetical protein
MQTFIEALYKSDSKIQFGWNPEPSTVVTSYNIYVSQTPNFPAVPTAIATGVSPTVSNETPNYKKIIYNADIATVRTFLSLPATVTFDNILLYWAITYVDQYLSESSLADSRIVEVPPVGVSGKTRKEDPTINRNIFGFSEELQKWIKAASSSKGAIIVSSSGYYQDNITTAYTYDSSNRILTELHYRSDMTMAGAPAKLVTNTYDTDNLLLRIVTDSTV